MISSLRSNAPRVADCSGIHVGENALVRGLAECGSGQTMQDRHSVDLALTFAGK